MIKWFAIAAGFALLVAGCNRQPAADGYKFEKHEFQRSDIEVSIVQFGNRSDFEKAAKAKGIADPAALAAFGAVATDEPRCTIYAMYIPNNYEPEYLGHELTHCIYGRFHN